MEDKSFNLRAKKPILPSEEELSQNNRSRSAKLRILYRGEEKDGRKYCSTNRKNG